MDLTTGDRRTDPISEADVLYLIFMGRFNEARWVSLDLRLAASDELEG